MDTNEMLDILSNYDNEDYDVVKALIPIVFEDSLKEYNKSFNFGDIARDDLKFLIIERIYWFLIDNAKWENTADIDVINDLVYEYYEK